MRKGHVLQRPGSQPRRRPNSYNRLRYLAGAAVPIVAVVFLAIPLALAKGLSLEIGVRLGSLMGSLKVAQQGPQSIELDLSAIRELYRAEYGESF